MKSLCLEDQVTVELIKTTLSDTENLTQEEFDNFCKILKERIIKK